MTEPSDALLPLPTFVRRRDGRLVPFDADHICQSLFEASARLGHPDAFLARELTDGLLHFLAADAETIPTTEQIRELAIKVVRELGQPALAASLAENLPASAASSPGLFSPDLVAAHHEGLLVLGGLDTPFELASCLLTPPDRVASLHQVCGQTVVLDGPEYTLAQEGISPRDFASQLREELQASRLTAVVNLNSSPPPWAGDLADGPLFASQRHAPDPRDLARLADELLGGLAIEPVRVDWHLSASDFEPSGEARLQQVIEVAQMEHGIAFVFDRPRRPVALAEGVDRRHPAVLLTVGLNLPRLAEHVLPGLRNGYRPDGEAVQRLVSKLAPLARMALSAGLQKRDFLRRHAHDRPALTRGFLLDRARLVVTPLGLETLTRMLVGRGLCSGGAALDLGRRVILRLREVLRAEGRASRLETCLDGAADRGGIMVCDAEAAPEQQLTVAGHLHAGGDTGTATVGLPSPVPVETMTRLLRYAWERTEVVRVHFRRSGSPRPQGGMA